MKKRNTRNKIIQIKTHFNFPKAKCIILLFLLFCCSGRKICSGEKRGVAATRKLSCGKARNLFETRTIFFHSVLRPNRKRVAFAFKGEPIL